MSEKEENIELIKKGLDDLDKASLEEIGSYIDSLISVRETNEHE